MNYQLFLDLATELGFRLSSCGAETYRVEESVKRLLTAYGISCDAFAVPYSLTVTVETDCGTSLMRMRRIDGSVSDLDAVERYSGLCRRICQEKPDPDTAFAWLRNTDSQRVYYTPLLQYIGYFLGSAGFGWFYGGAFTDGLSAGVCGLVGCAADRFFRRVQVNKFFSTILTAFFMALTAYLLHRLGLSPNPDATIIGSLMVLVPGLLFTNAMRDLIFGDTSSGTTRVIQVLLIAVSIALGTGAAQSFYSGIFGAPVTADNIVHSFLIIELACAVGCAGFAIFFNIHGPGMLICILGGVLTWGAYTLVMHLGGGDILAYFIASAFASLFAEIMARVRKYPAISYLVVSVFPLLPGGGIYYTMRHAVSSNTGLFTQHGIHTFAIAGAMAVGILLISTFFRFLAMRKANRLQSIKNS